MARCARCERVYMRRIARLAAVRVVNAVCLAGMLHGATCVSRGPVGPHTLPTRVVSMSRAGCQRTRAGWAQGRRYARSRMDRRVGAPCSNAGYRTCPLRIVPSASWSLTISEYFGNLTFSRMTSGPFTACTVLYATRRGRGDAREEKRSAMATLGDQKETGTR